jgi:hypothetical protein
MLGLMLKEKLERKLKERVQPMRQVVSRLNLDRSG